MPAPAPLKNAALDPELPPQLRSSLSSEGVIEDLNKCPFFMTQYDDQNGENDTLEALKAMAYEGEPDEIATNFKNQGNDAFKGKDYRSAIEYYTKGLAVKSGVKDLETKLYLNRAQCNLEIKNYRRCINDSQSALKLDPKLLKAYYRMGKAFLKLDKLKDSREAIEFGLSIDNDADLMKLLQQVQQRQESLHKAEEKREKLRSEKVETFNQAVAARNLTLVRTKNGDAKAEFKLENAFDIESQLVFGALILFPVIEYSTYLMEVGELSTIDDILLTVFSAEPIKDHTKDGCFVFMETLSGGLIKAGKNKTINELITLQAPKIPIIDNMLKIYIVEKAQSKQWLSTWDKEKALDQRLK